MKKLLVVLGLLCATFDTALAQTSGEITGEVKDPSGAVMPNASVTVTNTATNVARSTVTNIRGYTASRIWFLELIMLRFHPGASIP